MKARELLDILHVAERLKDTTRHCTTSKGRPESVAEHSWRVTLMAFLIRNEFPDCDMDKVMKMCLIHDLGECFIGDIPSFNKTREDEEREKTLLHEWVLSLPKDISKEMNDLYVEMAKLETKEAKIYKALDKMEAVIQHNESPLSTWLDHERKLNQEYGFENVGFSKWLTELREEILKDTLEKLDSEK